MEIKKLLCRCLIILLAFPVISFGDTAPNSVDTEAGMSPADKVSINDSMRWALEHSPRLKILQHNQQALDYEMKQAEGGQYPSLDLTSNYGADEHSDIVTRMPDADPANEEWEERGEVALVLKQKLYDGGAVSSQIAVQQAKLNSADHRVRDNAESIALDAVIAHLAVFRQSRLMTLSENNIRDHEEILTFLVKRQKGGAGNNADVTQAQGRLSRAKASSYSLQADLIASIANYERVVGRLPGDLQFAKTPETTPVELDQALALTFQGNPKILAFGSDVSEFESKLELARSADFPKVFLEVSKNYQHQVRGDASWQDTDAALVRMDWNLFNGGSDYAGKNAARSRVRQSNETLQNEILYATEETRSTWAQYKSVIQRKEVYAEATSYNRMTLDAYLKQFNVAQRSLLDVLDAENELFQSAGLLVTGQINELIAAGRLLALGGALVEAIFPPLDLPDPASQHIKTSLVQPRVSSPVIEIERIKLEVFFDTGLAMVKPEFHSEILRVADFLKKHPEVSGVIEGHTDNRGSAAYNQELSKRRADQVVAVLVDVYGIDASRLSGIGYGFSRPLASNDTLAGMARNRRIEASFVSR